jgi:hypothetical protein
MTSLKTLLKNLPQEVQEMVINELPDPKVIDLTYDEKISRLAQGKKLAKPIDLTDFFDLDTGISDQMETLDKNTPEVVMALVNQGFKIKQSDMNNAAWKGQLEIIKFFISKGVFPGEDALYNAVAQSKLSVIKFLVKYGIPVTEEITDLTVDPEILKVLLKSSGGGSSGTLLSMVKNSNLSGLAKHFKDGGKSSNLAFDAVSQVEDLTQRAKMVALFLNNQQEITTTVFESILYNFPLTKLFVKLGQTVNQESLKVAAKVGSVKTLKFLLQHNPQKPLLNTLAIIAADGNPKNFKFLLSLGAKMTKKTFIAATQDAGTEEVIKLHLDKKVWNKKYFEMVLETGNLKAIKYFLAVKDERAGRMVSLTESDLNLVAGGKNYDTPAAKLVALRVKDTD